MAMFWLLVIRVDRFTGQSSNREAWDAKVILFYDDQVRERVFPRDESFCSHLTRNAPFSHFFETF